MASIMRSFGSSMASLAIGDARTRNAHRVRASRSRSDRDGAGRCAWTGAAPRFSRLAVALAVSLAPHADVWGVDITTVDVRPDGGAWRSAAWDGLGRRPSSRATYEVRLRVDGGARRRDARRCRSAPGGSAWALDGTAAPLTAGPGRRAAGTAGAHEVVVTVDVSKYERRIACGERPRVGPRATTREGARRPRVRQPVRVRAGAGRRSSTCRPGHDLARPGPLLVGLHPWNGTMWTYAAYAELLREATARDVVLLLPSGLGNSLYTADAEDEVMRAIDALAEVVAVDPRRVSLWGASMGGAGATTIGFHHPDRFAERHQLLRRLAVRPDDVRARAPARRSRRARVNALDVVDNALHLPVWLVHGEDDRTSPIRQSEMLADAMRAPRVRGRSSTAFPGMGHSGRARRAVPLDAWSRGRRPRGCPTPVRGSSTGACDRGTRARTACISCARPSAETPSSPSKRAKTACTCSRAEGVRAIVVDPGALGTRADHPPPIVLDGMSGVTVRWAARTP